MKGKGWKEENQFKKLWIKQGKITYGGKRILNLKAKYSNVGKQNCYYQEKNLKDLKNILNEGKKNFRREGIF